MSLVKTRASASREECGANRNAKDLCRAERDERKTRSVAKVASGDGVDVKMSGTRPSRLDVQTERVRGEETKEEEMEPDDEAPSQNPLVFGRPIWISNDGMAQLPACTGDKAMALIRGTNAVLMCSSCSEHFRAHRHDTLTDKTRRTILGSAADVRQWWFRARNAVRVRNSQPAWGWDAPGRDDYAVDTPEWRDAFFRYFYAAAVHYRRRQRAAFAAYFLVVARILLTHPATAALARSLALHFFGITDLERYAPDAHDTASQPAPKRKGDSSTGRPPSGARRQTTIVTTEAVKAEAKKLRHLLLRDFKRDGTGGSARSSWGGPNAMVHALMRVELESNVDIRELSPPELHRHLSRRQETVYDSILTHHPSTPSATPSTTTTPTSSSRSTSSFSSQKDDWVTHILVKHSRGASKTPALSSASSPNQRPASAVSAPACLLSCSRK